MLTSLILAVAALAAPPTSTPTQASSAAIPAASSRASAPDNTKITADDQKVTCEEEATTGTMIADRVCHTNAQWRQMRDDAQEEIRENRNAAKTPG